MAGKYLLLELLAALLSLGLDAANSLATPSAFARSRTNTDRSILLYPSKSFFQQKQPQLSQSYQGGSTSHLFSDAVDGNGNDEFDAMRNMLESSWDATKMGRVPMDATEGAEEAATAVLAAIDQGVEIFLIDLLLPSYDITQGSNLYDEVLGVEYCIALAELMEGKTSILVRDGKTLSTCLLYTSPSPRD